MHSVPDSRGLPIDETRRLAVLRELAVLDSMPEAAFDAIVAAAAQACGVPTAMISLVDERRTWVKASVGRAAAGDTPRDLAFCDHAIRDVSLFEIPDARLDARFAANPWVTGGAEVRFYAGAPIVMPGGERIGAVCVVDRTPRRLDDAQRAVLHSLAAIVSSMLRQRSEVLGLGHRLVDSESHYRAIVEEQSELIAQARRDGTLTFVNVAYARHFGMEPAAMIGRSLFDFVADADRAQVREHIEAMYGTGETAAIVNRMKSADGATRWVAWTNRPMPGGGGVAEGLRCVGRDITEQHIAEQRLAESERRVRRLYEATPAILHSIDAEGRIVDVSDRWLALMGYARHEVVGRLSSDFLAPASRSHARDVVLPAFFRTGACDRVAYQFVRRDGALLDVLLSATLERDADGKVSRSLAVLEDVTEHKRMEAELGRTRAHLDAVVDNMPALVGYWDAHAVTRFANRDFQAAVGLPADRLIGCALPDIFASVDPQGYAAIAPRVAAVLAGRRQDFECALLTTSGLRQLHVTLVPAQPEDGRIDGFYGTWFDITGTKALELRQRESELRYRMLFEHLNSAYALHAVEVDAEGKPVDYRFLAANPAYCTMLALDPAKTVGARATDVFPHIAADPADWIGVFGRVALAGVPVRLEQLSAFSGRWWDIVAYRPAPGQFAVIAQDISGRKRLEAELALAQRRLRELEQQQGTATVGN